MKLESNSNWEFTPKKTPSEMSRKELTEAIASLKHVLENPEDAGYWDPTLIEGVKNRVEELEVELAQRPEGEIKLD